MKKDVSIENWILGGTVFILIFTIGCFAWFQYRMSIIEQYDNKDKMKPRHTKEIATYPFIVECYEHTKCRGKKVTILQTTENLQDSLDSAGFEGSIASVRIVKGPRLYRRRVGKLRFMKTPILQVSPYHVTWDRK